MLLLRMRLLEKQDANHEAAQNDHCTDEIGKQIWELLEYGTAREQCRIIDTWLRQRTSKTWS